MHRTEFPFTLPHGYLDAEGNLHRDGIMRLSTAADEITPLRDPRVQRNSGYLIIILLARVITRLGAIEQLNTKMIEELFSGDLVYLQDFYQRINHNGNTRFRVACPHCSGEFEVETAPMGE